MGDRANLILTDKSLKNTTTAGQARNGAIVLYSHCGGYSMAADLKTALEAARGRWEDPSYGSRIVVSRLVGDAWGRETGFGLLAGEFSDNERPLLAVDWPNKMVYRFGKGYVSPDDLDACEKTGEWTFDQFLELNEDALKKIMAD